MEAAIYWYEKATEKAATVPAEALAQLYEDGDGIEKDAKKAAYCRQIAEEDDE